MLLGRYYKNTTWAVYNYVTRNLQNHFKNNFGSLLLIKLGAGPVFRDFSSNNKQFDDILEDFKNNGEQVINKFNEKDLYPFTKDKILISMKPLVNINEIFRHYEKFEHQYNAQTFTQALQKIWTHQEMFSAESIESDGSSKKLQILLENMNKKIADMNIDESTHCLLYLTKLGIDSDHLTMQNLFSKCCDFLNAETEIPTNVLSRFSHTVNQRKEFYNASISNKIQCHAIKSLECADNFETLYLITTCFHNLISCVTNETIDKYMIKIEEVLLSNYDAQSIHVKHLLKIATFLSFPKWSYSANNLNRKLLIFLSNNIERMDSYEIEIMFRLFKGALEPANMLPRLLCAAEKMNECNHNVDLLALMANFNKAKRKKFIETARQVIKKDMIEIPNTSKGLSSVYQLLRSLKISDLKICDSYWSKVLEEINTNAAERRDFRLAKHCFRYMFFNNNVGGTFRHLQFERTVSKLAMENIMDKQHEKDDYRRIFAKLASFVIAYGVDNRNDTIIVPEFLIRNMEEMENEFDHFDCLQLSKGFQIASELRFKSEMSKERFSKINRIKTTIQNCVRRYLVADKIDLPKLNSIVKTLNNVKVKPSSELYFTAIELYKTVPSTNINSRAIREVAFNFLTSNYLVSNIVTYSFNYILKNKDYVLGDTVEKILHTAYTLAYIPEDEDTLHWSAEIIKRDFNYMTTMSIVRACLALCFFRALPLDLVEKVFTPEFIKRVEDEIELCYSKQTYPNRILNQVMQLNRAVCLDSPEIQIPWFQQNYIEAQMSKKTNKRSKLLTEIENVLFSVVKDKERVIFNQTTPYGYTIDFAVHLNYGNQVVSSKTSKMFAILLLRRDAFCENNNENIKGFEHMRIRHLEMLGFNVIHIKITDWNALHMNIPGAKKMYLKNLLKLS